jgi:hypothetical protein
MSQLNDFLSLIAEAKKQNPVEKVKESAKSDLGNIFAQLAEEKRKDPVAQKARQIEKQVSESVKSDLGSLFAQLASIQQRVEILPEETEGKAEAQQILAEVMLEPEPVPKEVEEETGVDMEEVSKYLTGKTFQQPNPDAPSRDIDDIRQKIKFLEQWLGKISAHGPGSGEVNFRYLDDVTRSTMTESNDNWVLEYDAATKKVQFTDEIGPIQIVKFDPTHDVSTHPHTVGSICWNNEDRTLNVFHPNGVTQQVGQEQYMLVRNTTGSTITNGTVVGFYGADSTSGEARILCSPFLADGSLLSLFLIGVATEDIPTEDEGLITTYGKVRDLDTTGTSVGETWQVGDILYANPTYTGKLTNVKPTAPNNVVPIAAALRIDSNVGEIFVRPTIEQQMAYGRFSDTTDQAPLVIDTPYAVTFDTTTISNGVSRGTPTSRIVVAESGFYDFVYSLSLTSTNSSAKAFYVWARKNGVDIPYSAKRQSITGNGTYQVLAGNFAVSMAAGDYLEVYYAANDTTISINAPPATAFSPAIPSATVTVTQLAL